MQKGKRVSLILFSILLISPLTPMTQAVTVIASESIDLVPAGNFSESSEWDISSSVGFSDDQAQHSIGMVADGELSFTHARPANFATQTSWSESSPTDSNYSIGASDSYYTWSKGPNITVGTFDFAGLNTFAIENVSLVLHFEIPEALNQDSVRIILQNTGSDKLVKTYTRTFNGVYRMNNPLVLELDEEADWNWNMAQGAQFTIDYVSTGTSDDSEVRVDAVGLRVKYQMPWYSFENVFANHEVSVSEVPVLDFGPYDGIHAGLSVENCGLIPDEDTQGTWDFNVEVPYGQELGRIHVLGGGNYTIEAMPQGHTSIENFQSYENGELLVERDETNSVRITIYDGCVSGVRIDVNDPHIVITGSISGATNGLTTPASSLRIAVGSYLVHTIPLELGTFSIEIPVGHALPSEGEMLSVGIATRFQWSSDGSAETTVVHVNSISITGGYHLEHDYEPDCLDLADLVMEEDEGGILIPVSCNDDRTSRSDLQLSATSEDNSLIEVSTSYSSSSDANYVQIQTVNNAFGETFVNVEMQDSVGNIWTDNFMVTITPIADSPTFAPLPLTVYLELGETLVLPLEIFDSDTFDLTITTSKSWATIDESNNLHLTPIDAGLHTVKISVNDGTSETSQDLSVSVSALPDLITESIEIRKDGTRIDSGKDADIIEIFIYVRNEGRGVADAINVRCYVDDVFVGSAIIDSIAPGGLGVAVCDAVLPGEGRDVIVRANADGTQSIDETNEENNQGEYTIYVSSPSTGTNEDSLVTGPTILVLAVGIVAIALTALQLSPNRVKKPYKRRK
jgi:hypothetical protein